ncbi:hypothetical protein FOZG_16990 [Fusarium oxysporum Fo47]|uniref:Uncharacterized protein n=1 Tax=Fusarium oxysporum Fo47 TaxID=660027 RepID=W9JBD7_FUSOX|nr:hypothetical protein FOZG_16990 [Fusarium oxysporum Fo47]
MASESIHGLRQSHSACRHGWIWQITGCYPVCPSHPRRVTPDQRLLGAREFEAEI